MMKKKSYHIALITLGGIGTGPLAEGVPVLHSFVDHLAKDHQVSVFSFSPPADGYKAKDYQLFYPKKRLSGWRSMLWLINSFRGRHKAQSIDIIHCVWGHPPGFFGWILKLWFGIPLLIHLQGGDAVYLKKIKYGILKPGWKTRLILRIYQKADALVVLTRYQKMKLKESSPKLSPMVIPFGLDLAKFVFQPRTPAPPFQLIHVAHLNPVKNQMTLLKAFAEILKKTDAYLHIYGVDSLDGFLQEQANALGIGDRVEFHGLKSHPEIIQALAQSHMLLHSSLYEGEGMAILEALASGVLVCGSKVGILSDLDKIATQTVPPEDYLQLAENAWKLLRDPEQGQKLREQGKVWVNAQDMSWTVRQFERVYDKMHS